jgi:hypothetical protein
MRALSVLTLFAAPLALAVPAIAAPPARAPVSTRRPVALDPAIELRERLEGVTEANIDRRPARALPAALRAEAWWKAHAKPLAFIAGGDSLIARVVGAARAGHPVAAARAAWELSERSFAPGSESLEDALMRLDLVGMAAWLRAHGQAVNWPDGTPGALDRIESRLTARHQATLARQFRAAADAGLATPVATAGDAHAATRLLDLVDVVEKALKT